MFRGILFQRILVISSVVVVGALVFPQLLRHWLADRTEQILATPVHIGGLKVFPRTGTIFLSDIVLGDQSSPAYMKVSNSWLTWKKDAWTNGSLRFEQAILSDVKIETDPRAHDYFGFLDQLQSRQVEQIIPSLYFDELGLKTHSDVERFTKSRVTTIDEYHSLWHKEKQQLELVTAELNAALAEIEKIGEVTPNKFRDRAELEATMQRALTIHQKYVTTRESVKHFSNRLNELDEQFEKQGEEGFSRAETDLTISDIMLREIADRQIKQFGLSQTSVWLDYIVTGRSLLGGLELPQLMQKQGREFYFSDKAPHAESLIENLTLRGDLLLHHRPHKVLMHGYNLRSNPKNLLITRIDRENTNKMEIPPTVLRGEINSQADTLLFDFRRLWRPEVNMESLATKSTKLPAMTFRSSDIITLESQAVGANHGELQISPEISLTWHGSKPWLWTQWRFEEDQRWRAKWVIRQDIVNLKSTELSQDSAVASVAAKVSQHLETVDRFDIELDVIYTNDRYNVKLTSNLNTWLPKLLKLVYEAEKEERLERIRTAIRNYGAAELSQLKELVRRDQTEAFARIDPQAKTLSRLSSILATKIGASPRVRISQESQTGIVR